MAPVPSRRYVSPVGRLTIEALGPRILQTHLVGHLDVQLARHLLATLEEWVALGGSKLMAFHDWEELVDYDAEARTVLTPWSRANRAKFDGIHMLIRGRAIAWGINIFNSLTGNNLKIHHARGSFAEARRAADDPTRRAG